MYNRQHLDELCELAVFLKLYFHTVIRIDKWFFSLHINFDITWCFLLILDIGRYILNRNCRFIALLTYGLSRLWLVIIIIIIIWPQLKWYRLKNKTSILTMCPKGCFTNNNTFVCSMNDSFVSWLLTVAVITIDHFLNDMKPKEIKFIDHTVKGCKVIFKSVYKRGQNDGKLLSTQKKVFGRDRVFFPACCMDQNNSFLKNYSTKVLIEISFKMLMNTCSCEGKCYRWSVSHFVGKKYFAFTFVLRKIRGSCVHGCVFVACSLLSV